MISKYYILWYTGRLEEVDFEGYVAGFEEPGIRVLVEETSYEENDNGRS